MIKWVFWDNDGVLVDTEFLYFRACRAILSRVGIRLTKDVFIDLSLNKGKSTIHLAAEKGLDPQTVNWLREERNRLYSRLLVNGVRVIDGVSEVLRKMRSRVSMGVVTGCRRVHFEIIHAKSGLLPYFSFVLTSDEIVPAKPDPSGYLKAIEKSGARPRQCVVVEDSERGLAAAKAAGLRCIVVPNALTAAGDFKGAFRVAQTIGEAAELILKM